MSLVGVLIPGVLLFLLGVVIGCLGRIKRNYLKCIKCGFKQRV